MVEVTLCVLSLPGYDTSSIMKSLREEVRWGNTTGGSVRAIVEGRESFKRTECAAFKFKAKIVQNYGEILSNPAGRINLFICLVLLTFLLYFLFLPFRLHT
jgi:hypothetical protein